MKRFNYDLLAMKVMLIIASLGVLFLDLYVLPLAIMTGGNNDYIMMPYLMVIYLSIYIMSFPFFVILYKAFITLHLIKIEQFYSLKTVKNFKVIKVCAYSITLVVFVDLPFLYLLADYEDAPGLLLVGIIIFGVSLFIALFITRFKLLIETKSV
jgi:hypothetical protein